MFWARNLPAHESWILFTLYSRFLVTGILRERTHFFVDTELLHGFEMLKCTFLRPRAVKLHLVIMLVAEQFLTIGYIQARRQAVMQQVLQVNVRTFRTEGLYCSRLRYYCTSQAWDTSCIVYLSYVHCIGIWCKANWIIFIGILLCQLITRIDINVLEVSVLKFILLDLFQLRRIDNCASRSWSLSYDGFSIRSWLCSIFLRKEFTQPLYRLSWRNCSYIKLLHWENKHALHFTVNYNQYFEKKIRSMLACVRLDHSPCMCIERRIPYFIIDSQDQPLHQVRLIMKYKNGSFISNKSSWSPSVKMVSDGLMDIVEKFMVYFKRR